MEHLAKDHPKTSQSYHQQCGHSGASGQRPPWKLSSIMWTQWSIWSKTTLKVIINNADTMEYLIRDHPKNLWQWVLIFKNLLGGCCFRNVGSVSDLWWRDYIKYIAHEGCCFRKVVSKRGTFREGVMNKYNTLSVKHSMKDAVLEKWSQRGASLVKGLWTNCNTQM